MNWWLAPVVPLCALGGLALAVHRVGRRPPVSPPRPLPAVVLGARVFPDGRPSDALVDRVRVGVRLLEEGHASQLVLSGGTMDGRPSEADVMEQLALSLGAAPHRLLKEARSRSTFENAAGCAALLDAREVLLVTCDFHMARARAHFHTRGFRVWAVPSPRRLRPIDRWRSTLKEALALLARPRLLLSLLAPANV